MLSIFRRKPRTPEQQSFNQRIEAFWSWFRQAAPRFYAEIEAGRSASLAGETSAKVDELVPGLAWVFGPGANGQGHSLTLSGEGIIHRQLLALHWLSHAPKIDGWTFYAARQPGPIVGHVLEIGGLKFDPKEIWVTPIVDPEDKNLDLTVWHPSFDRIDSGQRNAVTFLFLDEALGEYGTDWWIGSVEFGKDRLAGAFPLQELATQVQRTAAERGWKKQVPGNDWTLYRLTEPSGDFPRGDVVTQTTCIPRLFHEFNDSSGDYSDPLKGTGADYIYVSIDKSFYPRGEEVSRRGKIEEAVAEALETIAGGRCIGGACGTERSYSDFLIFDGGRSLSVIRKALREQNVPAGTMIEFFAREKRGQRIAI